MSDTPATLTCALVHAVRGLPLADPPADALEVARHCGLDFLAVALAGAREPLVEMLVQSIARPEASRAATLLGRRERASHLTAALINGAAGHALDFDDTHTAMNGHPTVPVLPALLVAAEAEPTSGRALLAALIAGIELECRLGQLLGAGHYAAGFHATATLGTFGAAAACAQLLGLDERGWCVALGLAGTQAAGLKLAFGSMAKPLHAGRAASAGLLAAQLARQGFTAPEDILGGELGFAATHAGGRPSAAQLEGWHHRFLIRDTLFKYHAACYLTHAAIEAAARLRAAPGFRLASVERVDVTVSPTLLDVCNIQEPRTGLEGKFSLRATVAMALRGDDTCDPACFTDAAVCDPALVALSARLRVATDAGLRPTAARVAIVSADRRVEADVDTGVAAADLAQQRQRLRAKFLALCTPVLGAAPAARLADAALAIDDAAVVTDLLALTCV